MPDGGALNCMTREDKKEKIHADRSKSGDGTLMILFRRFHKMRVSSSNSGRQAGMTFRNLTYTQKSCAVVTCKPVQFNTKVISEHQPQPDSRNSINGDTGNEPRLKRAPVACRRCRRLRGKCVHNGQTPCESCREAGPVEIKEW
jgi:hypothetical protein